MKLSEFFRLLESYRLRHNEDIMDPDVVVATKNPSIGPSSVSRIVNGFDWDKGKLIMHTEDALCRVFNTNSEKIDKAGNELLVNLNKISNMPRNRKDCWLDGFKYGAKYGITKLDENNK